MFELGLNTRLNPGKHRSAKLRLILVGTVSMGIQGTAVNIDLAVKDAEIRSYTACRDGYGHPGKQPFFYKIATKLRLS